MSNIKDNLLQLIGKTPLVRLSNIYKDEYGTEIIAKVEYFNPGGTTGRLFRHLSCSGGLCHTHSRRSGPETCRTTALCRNNHLFAHPFRRSKSR